MQQITTITKEQFLGIKIHHAADYESAVQLVSNLNASLLIHNHNPAAECAGRLLAIKEGKDTVVIFNES